MCLNNLLPLGIIFMVVVMIYGYKMMVQNAGINFDTLSGLLDKPTRSARFLKTILEGYYKGRKVVLWYLFFGENNNSTSFFVELKISLGKPKLFCISYPKITQNTQLKGDKVFYNPRIGPVGIWFRNTSRASWGNISVYSQEEFAAILEELTKAAEIAEKGQGHA